MSGRRGLVWLEPPRVFPRTVSVWRFRGWRLYKNNDTIEYLAGRLEEGRLGDPSSLVKYLMIIYDYSITRPLLRTIESDAFVSRTNLSCESWYVRTANSGTCLVCSCIAS